MSPDEIATMLEKIAYELEYTAVVDADDLKKELINILRDVAKEIATA